MDGFLKQVNQKVNLEHPPNEKPTRPPACRDIAILKDTFFFKNLSKKQFIPYFA